jgi:hypothetical protein
VIPSSESSPAELSTLIVRAAERADAVGFWPGAGSIAADATTHIVRFLGLILAGDQELHPKELNLYGRVMQAVLGERPTHDDLQVAALEGLDAATDPAALEAFIHHTPPYLGALVEMDRAHQTREARRVVEALGALGYAVLEADGRATTEEGHIFRGHINHLRDALARGGVADAP